MPDWIAVSAFVLTLIGVIVTGVRVVGRVESTTGVLAERMESLKEALAELRKAIDRLSGNHDGLEHRLRDLEGHVATLRAEVDRLLSEGR